MVIVFDLDDTLYEELLFVRSGFRAVADFLQPILKQEANQIYEGLNAELAIGRDHIFNRYLFKQGVKGLQLVKRCVSVYRGHQPRLNLFPEARACLERLQAYPLYIVTDGNQIVQRRKFFALGLDLLVRRCFFTYAHGLHRSKPSPYCFEKICHLEGVHPSQVVYVADNPHKDFVGIKPLGFQTVRVMTGPYKHDIVDTSYDADFKIPSLKAFNELLLKQLQNKTA